MCKHVVLKFLLYLIKFEMIDEVSHLTDDAPVEKNSKCWLGRFWSMDAGLSWFKLVMCWS